MHTKSPSLRVRRNSYFVVFELRLASDIAPDLGGPDQRPTGTRLYNRGRPGQTMFILLLTIQAFPFSYLVGC